MAIWWILILKQTIKIKNKLCERTAAAIVKIFEDDDRLKKFHENSYMIAEEYKEHVIESKWMQLIKNIP